MSKKRDLADAGRGETKSRAAEEAIEEAGRETYVRLNLEVPRSLRNRIKHRAIREGLTVKELGTKILREYLERMNE